MRFLTSACVFCSAPVAKRQYIDHIQRADNPGDHCRWTDDGRISKETYPIVDETDERLRKLLGANLLVQRSVAVIDERIGELIRRETNERE